MSSGSSWEAVSIYDGVVASGRECRLWATKTPGDDWLETYSITKISLPLMRFPKDGTFLFVGPPPNLTWYRLAKPRRVIMICNYFSKKRFSKRYEQLSRGGRQDVELVYCSQLVRDYIGKEGRVHWSPIDIGRFAPGERKPGSTADRFVVGRLSRDGKSKFGSQNAALYKALADQGCSVRLMGATCMRPQLEGAAGIEILAARTEDATEFLRGLDCFVYRTSETWTEPWGRVVTEAMACGIPCVVENRGGYAAILEHGRTGFLFETNEEALEHILALKADRELCARVGAAGRARCGEVFSAEALGEPLDYYMR
jgi:glycosyltransferase involved in cell wall biosynthesis